MDGCERVRRGVIVDQAVIDWEGWDDPAIRRREHSSARRTAARHRPSSARTDKHAGLEVVFFLGKGS